MAFPVDVLKLSELVADRIVGAFIATAEAGNRWVLSASEQTNEIYGYTGDPQEIQPARIQTLPFVSMLRLLITGPTRSNGGTPSLDMRSGDFGTSNSSAKLSAQGVTMQGGLAGDVTISVSDDGVQIQGPGAFIPHVIAASQAGTITRSWPAGLSGPYEIALDGLRFSTAPAVVANSETANITVIHCQTRTTSEFWMYVRCSAVITGRVNWYARELG